MSRLNELLESIKSMEPANKAEQPFGVELQPSEHPGEVIVTASVTTQVSNFHVADLNGNHGLRAVMGVETDEDAIKALTNAIEQRLRSFAEEASGTQFTISQQPEATLFTFTLPPNPEIPKEDLEGKILAEMSAAYSKALSNSRPSTSRNAGKATQHHRS